MQIDNTTNPKKQPGAIETMSTILGSNYQVISSGMADPIVLAKLPYEDLAPKNSVDHEVTDEPRQQPSSSSQLPQEKTTDDYLFQFYLGSITVVGLFVLFRMIQKSK